jgi:hypothetical protein
MMRMATNKLCVLIEKYWHEFFFVEEIVYLLYYLPLPYLCAHAHMIMINVKSIQYFDEKIILGFRKVEIIYSKMHIDIDS